MATENKNNGVQGMFDALGNGVNLVAQRNAQQFYTSDVQPRAEKYRNIIQQTLHSTPTFDPSVIHWQATMPKDVLGYQTSTGIYVPKNVEAHTLVHEMTHEDQTREMIGGRDSHDWLFPILKRVNSTFRVALWGGGDDYTWRNDIDVPIKELRKINAAYQPPSRVIVRDRETNELAEVATSQLIPEADQVTEKHASNRTLRYNLWSALKEQLGRVPTMEELDNYIRSLTLDDFKRFASDSYQDLYFMNDYIDLDAVKKSLIEVAQNNAPQNTMTAYARHGSKLNYLQFFNGR